MPRRLAQRLQELERRADRFAPRKAPGLFYLDVDQGLYEKAVALIRDGEKENASQPLDSPKTGE